MDICSLVPFVVNITSTVIGGVILAFLFFLTREKLCPLPAVAGRWCFEMHTKNTSYMPYEGMTLKYVAILWREGNVIQGTAEKTYEKSSEGEIEYVGKNRTRGRVNGYIEKNYFSKDRLFLHIVEHGEIRKSTQFHKLICISNKPMKGTFVSTVADQDGEVVWQKDS